MESVIRNVREINSSDRQALEHVLGQKLKENQQVIIQVVSVGLEPAVESGRASPNRLPDWCDVYAGLTDEQVAEVEEIILQRADLARTSE